MRLSPPVAACLAALSLPTHGDLVNRWSFNESSGGAPAGTSIADSVGTSPGAVVGLGATFDGTSLLLPGTTNGNQTPANISAYVDLPNGLISSKTNLTVEIWATPQSDRFWQRLFDFGRMGTLSSGVRGTGALNGEILPNATQAPNNAGSSDDFALAVNRTATANTQRVMARLDGAAELGSNTGATINPGTQYHFVCTFTDGAGTYGTSGGQIAWYLNGTLVTTLDVNFHLSSIQDRNNWLGRSMFSADDNSHISYNEVRLYDHALNPAEITGSLAGGPDHVGPPDPDPPPVPVHLWTFTTQAQSETPSGTTFTDSISGMNATLRGNGGSLTGSAVVLPGSTTGNQPAATISAYLDLPNGSITQTASVTLEAWASPLSSKNWQRLFDFGRCGGSNGTGAAPGEILDGSTAPGGTAGYDNFSLTFNNAGNINSQQLEGQNDGGAAQYTFTAAATTPGTQYHYVFVVEDGVGTYGSSGCQVRWYRDGALQNSMDFAFRLPDIQDVNNWIGRSMYSGDSNSHMSLNELRIYRRAITPVEIAASLAAGPDPATGPAEPPAPPPVPERRWTFDTAAGGAPAGSTFLDTATGEIATVQGNGATLTGTQLLLPAAATNGNQTAAAISAYLDLPDGIISSRPDLTVEAWVTPQSSKNWQRIFDFGNSSLTSGPGADPGEIIDSENAPGNFIASDNLLLSLNIGGTLGSHRLEAKLNGGGTVTNDTDLSGTTAAGTQYHYVMTVKDGAGAAGASGCLVKWFRNGVSYGTIDLPYRLPDLEDVNNWIGRSMWAADSNSNLSLNELRLHSRAISTAEVIASFNAGPDASFSPPVAFADSATIHPYQKVLVDVLANDSGAPVASTLSIVAPPATGAAVVSGGKILYTHSGSSASPVSFTYGVGNVSGITSTATVTIQFATTLRIANPALAMPAAPPSSAWQIVDALPGLSFNEPLCIASIPGNNRAMFVCERMAKIQRVADVTAATPARNLFLDMQAVVAGRTPAETIEGGGNGEHGLLGLAFHPQYATNGYFYAAYTVRINGGSYYQRISRFQVNASDPTTADPASELILLQQLDEGSNHDGGDLHFGPDGYLYYAAGDEENPNDFRLNSQLITKDFFAGIFRIDVDKKPGNLEPNPHASIPTDGGIARFSVPADNPFVHTSLGGAWDGFYNGVEITNLTSVRGEFWATGLRHVWRMSFDPSTGDLWAGDVGQNTYEEINKIVKGGNYGWVYREGAHDTNLRTPLPAGFTSIDPFYEYVHTAIAGGDAAFKGNSVVGGHVYRGSRFPELYGSYVFSDSVSGHVWQMNTTTGAVTRISGMPGAYGVIASQGVDPANGDILFCAYLTGKIVRLTMGDLAGGDFPSTLTETGLFADLTDLSPSPGLLPYQPNLTFWSDHALKRRWFAIPDGSSTMTWNREQPWTYPTGTVWVKHFDLEMSRGNPATRKRIETRVLVKTDSGSYGVSYRWNEAQTEATLVPEAGVEFDLSIDDQGTPHTQRWQIPGRSSCLTCHTPQAGHALSFNTRQLNRVESINGWSGNQIQVLSDHGFLSNTPPPVSGLPRHVRPDESQFPLEQRARSYLAVNCSYCHQDGGSVSGFWDGRELLKLEETGLIRGDAVNDGGDPLNQYIVPGDPVHSIILSRMAASNGFTRMPPLGTTELDAVNLQLITDWISNELPDRALYDPWRDSYFSSFDPDGDKAADPDGDGVSNYDEYLRGTSPISGANPWQATIAGGMLQFTRKAYRYYDIETSEDLVNWTPWSQPEIDSAYQSEDGVTNLTLPEAPGGKMFFRFNVTEP
jgi:uncharacterized repeat protein (TIGR03806 family)